MLSQQSRIIRINKMIDRYKLYRGAMHQDENGKYILFDDFVELFILIIKLHNSNTGNEFDIYSEKIDKFINDNESLINWDELFPEEK